MDLAKIEDILNETKEIKTSYEKLADLLTYPEILIDKTYFMYLLKKQNSIKKAYEIRSNLEDKNGSNLDELYDALKHELSVLGDDGTPGVKITLQGDESVKNSILKSVYAISKKNAYDVKDIENGVILYGIGAYSYYKNLVGIYKENGKEARLFAYPKYEEKVFSEKDVKIDLFHSDGAGGQNVNKVETAIRATDLITGIVVVCKDERSQLQNKIKALEALKTKVKNYYLTEEINREKKLYKEQLKINKVING